MDWIDADDTVGWHVAAVVAISELIGCLLTCSSLLLCAFITCPFFVFFFLFLHAMLPGREL